MVALQLGSTRVDTDSAKNRYYLLTCPVKKEFSMLIRVKRLAHMFSESAYLIQCSKIKRHSSQNNIAASLKFFVVTRNISIPDAGFKIKSNQRIRVGGARQAGGAVARATDNVVDSASEGGRRRSAATVHKILIQ